MTIVELLEEYGVEYRMPGEHEHVGRSWVGVDCPNCSPGWKHFRMGWSTTKKYFNCWSCGPCRTTATLVQLLGVSEQKAYKILKELKANDDTNPVLHGLAVRGELRPPAGVGPMSHFHKKYLRRRGFSPKQVADVWGVKGIGVAARLAWRLYIPIHDKKGEIVSWTTRSISDRHPMRYISAKASQEKVSHKQLLYGEWAVPGHAVVVVEGPTDVWAVGPGAVSTAGLSFTPHQVWKIAQYPVRVVCFDNEEAAQKKADKLCEQLAPFDGETYRVRLESGKDPGDCLLSEKGLAELAWLRNRFLSAEVAT